MSITTFLALWMHFAGCLLH